MSASRALEIGHGSTLALADIVQVARLPSTTRVVIPPAAKERVRLGETVVEALRRRGVKIYGITTGFASLRDRPVSGEDAARLSTRLIRSHASGVGPPLPEDVVRATILLRAHTLGQGNSGASVELLELLVSMLNGRIYPYVPEQGSVGSSGDLAPLSQLMLAAIADPLGRVHRRLLEGDPSPPADPFLAWADGRREDDAYVAAARPEDFVALVGPARRRLLQALGRAQPYVLKAKEGLACNNGAVVSTAILALATHDALRLLETAELAAALSLEALQAVPDFLDERIAALRPHPGHLLAVQSLRRCVAGSELVPAGGSQGFNAGHFTAAALELGRLRREVDRLATSLGEDARLGRLSEELALLQRQMLELRRDLPARLAASRLEVAAEERDPRLPRAPERVLELTACARVFEPVKGAWRAWLGLEEHTGHTPPEPPPWLRERMAAAYHEHVTRVVRSPADPEVQDNYSFRAAPTVLGAAREAVERALRTAQIEANSATDNPLVLLDPILDAYRLAQPEGARAEGAGPLLPAPGDLARWLEGSWAVAAGCVLSAANFHGEPIGLAADALGAALAEVGSISERRVAGLTDRHHSKGLPSYLIWSPGLDSGLMMAQYVAASLVAEDRVLAVPAATDSVPTGEATEDHVAMSTLAARRLATLVGNLERLVAIELLVAYQALQFRKPLRPGVLTGRLEAAIAAELGGFLRDLSIDPVDEKLRDLPEAEAVARALGLRTGLEAGMFRGVRPCVVEDLPPYPLIEAIAFLVRRGRLRPDTLA